MRMLSLVACLILLMTACNTEEPKTEKPKEEQLIVREKGKHTEYYPGKKQIKIQGELDADDKRHGKWSFYDEKGLELTTTVYSHGIKQGFSLVKFPNGQIRYYGDYHNDKQIGVWKTYDMKGQLVDSTDYGPAVMTE